MELIQHLRDSRSANENREISKASCKSCAANFGGRETLRCESKTAQNCHQTTFIAERPIFRVCGIIWRIIIHKIRVYGRSCTSFLGGRSFQNLLRSEDFVSSKIFCPPRFSVCLSSGSAIMDGDPGTANCVLSDIIH